MRFMQSSSLVTRIERCSRIGLSLVLPKTVDEKASSMQPSIGSFRLAPIRTAAQPTTRRHDARDRPISPAQRPERGEGGTGRRQRARTRPVTRRTSRHRGSVQSHHSSTSQSALGQLLMRGNRIEIGMAISAAGQRMGVDASKCSLKRACTRGAFWKRWVSPGSRRRFSELAAPRRPSSRCSAESPSRLAA